MRFGDIVENVNERVEPSTAAEEIYVGLDDLDSGSLHIRRWGKGSDVIGTKLRFRKGDIIFGRRRAYQRKLAVAEVDGICSTHAMVARAKPKVIQLKNWMLARLILKAQSSSQQHLKTKMTWARVAASS